jgi:chaperonin GroEL (HSP60 family)
MEIHLMLAKEIIKLNKTKPKKSQNYQHAMERTELKELTAELKSSSQSALVTSQKSFKKVKKHHAEPNQTAMRTQVCQQEKEKVNAIRREQQHHSSNSKVIKNINTTTNTVIIIDKMLMMLPLLMPVREITKPKKIKPRLSPSYQLAMEAMESKALIAWSQRQQRKRALFN